MLNLKLFRSIQSRSKLNDILFEFKICQPISRFLSQNNNSSFAEFELFPEDLSAEQAYYYNETNQQQILNNIKSREIEDSFPELFDRNLSIEELGNRLVKLSKRLPNTFHPIWLVIHSIPKALNNNFFFSQESKKTRNLCLRNCWRKKRFRFRSKTSGRNLIREEIITTFWQK